MNVTRRQKCTEYSRFGELQLRGRFNSVSPTPQRDLCKLRLSTAKHYVKIITDGQGPVSYAAGASLRLNAQVQGLGPLFKIKLSIQVSTIFCGLWLI